MVFSRIALNIKQRSNATLKAWCYQCESILAQRSRRIQQLFTFYHRVYGTQGLKQLLRSYHRHLPAFRGSGFVLSAAGVMGVSVASGQTFDWSLERLSLINFDRCQRDIDFLNSLSQNNLCHLCKEKKMRHCYCLIGNKQLLSKTESLKSGTYTNYPNIYLEGNDIDGCAVMGKAIIQNDSDNAWEPYFSKDQFCVWRREERNSMYSYKVYAYFKDISAADFLHVQTDLEYRRKWDDTAITLKLIEEDPIPGNNSHLIYWEMQWPKLFANRDYVYSRRFISDEKRQVMLVVSRGTKHPMYPACSGKVRVNDYWSFMVIKPLDSFHEPGVHYILTYFDDPGFPIPQSIKSWVTQKQMPDFLQKMYQATKEYSYKRALVMNRVFNSFTNLNNDYRANDSREGWLKRLLRNSGDIFKQKSDEDE